MNDTLSDVSRQIFYQVAQKDEGDVDFQVSFKQEFPAFFTKPRIKAVVSLPKLQNEKHYLQGFVFDDYEKLWPTMWALYLASIYHLGAHAAVSNFQIYDKWRKNKTAEHSTRVINFIEDLRVNQYLQEKFTKSYQNITEIDSKYSTFFENFYSDNASNTKQRFSKFFHLDESTKVDDVKQKIIEKINDSSNLIECADILYETRSVLKPFILPYHDHSNYYKNLQNLNPIIIKPTRKFYDSISLLSETWKHESKKRKRVLNTYEKFAEELHFDEIDFPAEDFSEYLRLKSESVELINKIKNRLKMVSNVIDTPKSELMGNVEMQKAIQATASQDYSMEIFEQEEERRSSESWTIIIDISDSMKIKFQGIKKLALCISEAAEKVNSPNGNWSLAGFNNNYLIVKDLTERYNQQVKSRLGGIENKGLSFIPDAIMVAIKTLEKDQSEKKYIILVTDGRALGYDKIDVNLKNAISYAESCGINIIGIGVPDGKSKLFTTSFPHGEIIRTVTKFIQAYISVSQDNL